MRIISQSSNFQVSNSPFPFKLSRLTKYAKISINCSWFFLNVTASLKSLSPWTFTAFKKNGTNLLVFFGSVNLCNGRSSVSLIHLNGTGAIPLPPTQISISFLHYPKGSVQLLSSEQWEQPVYLDIRLGLSDIYMKTQHSQRDLSFLKEEINDIPFH